MRIALINENSQASKNGLVFSVLENVAKRYGHSVVNYGMYGEDDTHSLTYVKAGLLSAILLNSKAVDFVVTGCGTGEGAMLALNAFPGVLCGHIVDSTDAYMFRQINNGNAISLPLAKGFGWGSELALEQIFNELLKCDGGGGYPESRAVPERQNKEILDNVKKITHQSIYYILENIDREFLKDTINYDFFKKDFFENSKDQKINEILNSILN